VKISYIADSKTSGARCIISVMKFGFAGVVPVVVISDAPPLVRAPVNSFEF